MAHDWVEEVHPVYKANKDRWALNEIRLRGDEEVLAELRPFDWEITKDKVEMDGPIMRWSTSEKYRARQQQATYHNYPDLFALVMVGHLMRQSPQPGQGMNFGGLGELGESRRSRPSKADLIWYNVDGRGNDGSQWPNWWAQLERNAFATGHRIVLVETASAILVDGEGNPRQATQAEMIRGGIRPWLKEWSPLDVTNWHFEDGVLQWIVFRESRRRPRVKDGKLEGNASEDAHLLYVRQGWSDLGDEFSVGGWWRFDEDNEMIDGEHATLERTNGEIPAFFHYYERDTGTNVRPAISRPAITALGQLAVSYMNLSSAADFDAWDAALSLTFFLGVDPESHNIAINKMRDGSRWIPLPPAFGGDDKGAIIPSVYDGSAGAVVAAVFAELLKRKREEAREISAREVTSTPDSSGRSKEAGFGQAMAPRLSLMASELENSQNTALYYLEKRFGIETPTAEVKWPKEFKLLSVIEEIDEMFGLIDKGNLRSTSLTAKLLTNAAKEKGLVIGKDESDQVEREFKASALREIVSQIRDELGLKPAALTVAAAIRTLDAAGLFDENGDGEATLNRDQVVAALQGAAEAGAQQDALDGELDRLLPFPRR